MKNVLEEVDQALRCIPEMCPIRFLDVGCVSTIRSYSTFVIIGCFFPSCRCCPGGFSSYILNKNVHSTGVGISLDVESGGHAFLLEENLRPRLELKLTDLTRYQLGPAPVMDPLLQP